MVLAQQKAWRFVAGDGRCVDVREKGLSAGGAKNNKIGLPYSIYADTMKSANRTVSGPCPATAPPGIEIRYLLIDIEYLAISCLRYCLKIGVQVRQ
jgi:hypothetical protein